MAEAANKYAVVTGANKGIGFEICRQLASQGITVVLTARDENRGLEAVEKLRGQHGLSILFHQLDVMDSASAQALHHFIDSRFGKLDILVNNAGVLGSTLPGKALKSLIEAAGGPQSVPTREFETETYNEAVLAIQTNYYGAKRTTETLLPLLHLSDSPRIVNVSSAMGMLENIPGERIREILGDAEKLTEERIDGVLNDLLQDLKEGSSKDKGWPTHLAAYTVSKAAKNAYTRVLAEQCQRFRINCLCPGYVKTDINYNTGNLTPAEGASRVVRLALLPDDGPSGCFFVRNEVTEF